MEFTRSYIQKTSSRIIELLSDIGDLNSFEPRASTKIILDENEFIYFDYDRLRDGARAVGYAFDVRTQNNQYPLQIFISPEEHLLLTTVKSVQGLKKHQTVGIDDSGNRIQQRYARYSGFPSLIRNLSRLSDAA